MGWLGTFVCAVLILCASVGVAVMVVNLLDGRPGGP